MVLISMNYFIIAQNEHILLIHMGVYVKICLVNTDE
jgi:hypothetical protein